MHINNSIRDQGLIAAICVANDIVVRPSSEQLASQLQSLVAQRKDQEFPAPSVKDAVRGLLKTGGFKPSGRNKPASEYLAQAAREDRFPAINNLVDVNNFVSLSTGLPISLLDAAEFGESLLLRYGREAERYVFNSGGQEIDLNGLICACAATSDAPLGNPIKDSLTGKIKDATRSVVGIIYAPSSMSETAKTGLALIAQLIASEGSASSTETFLV
ncbi:MAG TPA: phenylalanine--tRNA ligase beta subunit-related protein [Candidatus Obscuribacterales bacterium]